MKDLAKKISDKTTEMLSDLSDNVFNGNKAAGRRARKTSLELEKLLKEYRKESVK